MTLEAQATKTFPEAMNDYSRTVGQELRNDDLKQTARKLGPMTGIFAGTVTGLIAAKLAGAEFGPGQQHFITTVVSSPDSTINALTATALAIPPVALAVDKMRGQMTGSSSAAGGPEKPLEQCITYTVQPGDNLWRIAEKNDTTWQVLADDNDLADPRLIHPGDKLKVKCDTDGPELSENNVAPTYSAFVPALKETNNAVYLLNQVVRKVLKPSDFYDSKYHSFTPNRLRNNIVFVYGENWGGGESASFYYYGQPDRPMTLFGPYNTIGLDRIERNEAGAIFIQNFVHEGFIHSTQDLVLNREPSDENDYNIEHSAMGWAEDLVRQEYGISWGHPDKQLIFATDRIARVSSRQEALTLMLQIGFGKTDVIAKAQKYYNKGKEKSDPLWADLWNGDDMKLRLSDDRIGDLLNPLRKELDKMFVVPFTAY